MRRIVLVLGVGLAVLGGSAYAVARPRAHAAFVVAGHRNPPVVNRHGWVAKPLRIMTFVQQGLTDGEALRQFPFAILHSRWFAKFRAAYGIPPGSIAAGINVQQLPAITTGTTIADFQNWIDARMHQIHFVGRPGFQTIYLLYIPCSGGHGIDSFGCVSHHPGLAPLPSDSIFTHNDAVAISYYDPSQPFDRQGATMTAIHELAEAATDEDTTGWYRQVSNLDKPWLDGSSPWVEDEGSGHIEVADLAAGSRWREKYRANGVTYDYVRIVSNQAIAQHGDPAVPKSPHPYYNVSAPSTWYELPIASSKTVKVTGWSTRKIPRWDVNAGTVSWKGSKDGSGQNPCHVPVKDFKVGNYDKHHPKRGSFNLKVTATSTAKLDDWCVIRLKSSRFADSQHGDFFHPWFVGFIVRHKPATAHPAAR